MCRPRFWRNPRSPAWQWKGSLRTGTSNSEDSSLYGEVVIDNETQSVAKLHLALLLSFTDSLQLDKMYDACQAEALLIPAYNIPVQLAQLRDLDQSEDSGLVASLVEFISVNEKVGISVLFSTQLHAPNTLLFRCPSSPYQTHNRDVQQMFWSSSQQAI